MNPYLLLFPVIAAAAWERLFRRATPDLLLRLLLASLCTLMQLSSGLALLGFLGLLRPAVAIGLQALVTIGLFAACWRRGEAPESPPAVAPPERWWERLALVVVSALSLPILARMLFYASVMEPFTMDGLAYHLPPLVELLQRGRFVLSDTLDVWALAYPKNVEMIDLWLMLGHNGRLILFGQVLFLPAGVLGVALIARRFVASRSLALAAGLCLLFVPIVVTQGTAEYIDIAVGCTLLACAALTLAYRDGMLPRPWGPVVLLAALGFLAGQKYNGPLVAGVFGLLAFWPDLWRRRLGWAHLVGVAAAVPGVIWYFANILWFRNPLWPFAIPGMAWLAPHTSKVADIMLPNTPPEFRGQSPWLSAWQVWREQYPKAELYSVDSRFGGLGPLWFILWLPAIPFWLLRRGPKMLTLVAFLLFAAMEAFWWTRYTWWIVGLGIVAFAALWREMPWPLRAGTGVATVACAVYVLFNTIAIQPFGVPFRLQDGTDPFAAVRQRQGEVIALSRLPWEQYYLYGDDYSNRLVLVAEEESADSAIATMRAAGATLYFASEENDPLVPLIQSCLEEVDPYGPPGPAVYQFTCR